MLTAVGEGPSMFDSDVFMRVYPPPRLDRFMLRVYKSAYFPHTGGSPKCQHQASVTAKDSATTLACNPMQIGMTTEPTFVSDTLSVKT